MKVVILCGGQGTRIRGVADDIPKPMIPIGGRPILWHIMKEYAARRHTDFVLCLGYKSQVIKEFFRNYHTHTSDFTVTLGRNGGVEYHGDHDESGWRVTLAETGLDAMTGARVKRVQRYLDDDENFMLTYGDGVADIDLDALFAFHKAHGRILTVTGVRPPGRFGEMECDPEGRVTEFNEKPQTSGGRISGGYFVCRRELFDYLDDSENLVLEIAPMHALARDGQMRMYRHDGFWQCMDTYRDFQLLETLWGSQNAPWKVW